MPAVKTVALPNGVTLPYVVQGDRTGTPIVLVHAVIDSLHIFEPLLDLLPGEIRAYAPTQRGHGDADRPPTGYRPEDFAEDLVAFVDALGIETAVFAGGSSGGVVARRVAIDHPDRVSGLVLMGSPLTLRGKPRVQEMWESTFSKLEDPIAPALVRGFVESTVTRTVSSDTLEPLVRESLKVPAHVWKETMRGMLEDESSEELHKIDAPTLIAWGDQDPILPRSDQEAMAKAISGSRLVVYPGAGHMFYLEEPERFAPDLVAFLEAMGD